MENNCRDDLKSLAAKDPEGAVALRDPHSAQSRRRDALIRQTVAPFFTTPIDAIDWNGPGGIGQFLSEQKEKHGLIGLSAVCTAGKAIFGAEVLGRDLPVFERNYIEYFKTATGRSGMSINALSWEIFLYSKDPMALEAAVAADKYSLETFEPGNPYSVDTYASLLYKVGRVPEALQYEKRAVELSGGQNNDINAVFDKMKAGKATWPTD